MKKAPRSSKAASAKTRSVKAKSTATAKPTKMQLAILFAAVAGLIVFAVLAIFYPAKAAEVSTVLVGPSNVKSLTSLTTGSAGWYRDVAGTSGVELTSTKPYNTIGSAEFYTVDPGSYAELGLYKQFGATRLSDLSDISYATWQQNGNVKAVSLQIGIDADVTDSDFSNQGRMVFEPHQNTDYYGYPLVDSTWQTWLTLKPESNWWLTWSDAMTTKYGTNPCPQSAPCSYSFIQYLYPDLGFNSALNSPLVLRGENSVGNFNGYADATTVTLLNGNSTFWDFEPSNAAPTTPTTKDECKNDGWQNFGGVFKNQGACVSFLENQKN